MKSSQDFMLELNSTPAEQRLPLIEKRDAEIFKAGQDATMKWVSEECRRQTERLIAIQHDPNYKAPPQHGDWRDIYG